VPLARTMIELAFKSGVLLALAAVLVLVRR
jgi:hypothetical protein